MLIVDFKFDDAVLDRTPSIVKFPALPSVSLSTYSYERMQHPLFKSNVELIPNTQVSRVEEVSRGYQVLTRDGLRFNTITSPLLAIGFAGGHGLVADLFELRKDGFPLLNKNDESTQVSGVFLCGPYVRQGNLIFCFIFKYRQRFAVVVVLVGHLFLINVPVAKHARERFVGC